MTLACAGCGEVFKPGGISLQEMIVQRGRRLFHMEPCSIAPAVAGLVGWRAPDSVGDESHRPRLSDGARA